MANDLRPELSEAVGTFLMMLAGGAAILAGQSALVVALVFGVVVMVMIYAVGHVGGAHFNPAVTLAFAATGHFPRRRVLRYVLAQFLGATAACMLLATWQPVTPLVAVGAFEGLRGFAVEVIATAMLSFVIIAVATDARAAPGTAGLAIGATVFLGSLVAGPLTGAAMNPARALAPMVVSGDYLQALVHIAGPFFGGVLGMAVYEVVRGGKKTVRGTLGSAGPIELEAS